MEIENTSSDLEDGEIRDEAYEDISDCALSDVLQGEFSEDNDIDSLRKEALESLHATDDMNEEEKYRLEALKSLLQNTDFLDENESLHEVEGLTEEEKYRLEAMKSLLRNTNFLSVNESKPTAPKKRRKKKRNRRGLSKHMRLKSNENNCFLEETKSLLSELSEDVRKINKSLETKKTENDHVINEENDVGDHVEKYTESDSANNLRSWYPKTEFTLLDISSARNINLTCYSSDGNHKVATKCEKNVSKSNPKSSTKNSPKSKKLPKVKFDESNVTEIQNMSEVINSVATKPSVSVPVQNNIKKPTIRCDFNSKPKTIVKILPQTHTAPALRTPTKFIAMPPRPTNSCRFRKFKIIPHGNFSFIRKKDKYKINNLLTSKYVLRKTLKIDKSKLKLNKTVKSRYSINRTKQFPQINPKEFVISLEDEDSSKEDDPKPSIVHDTHEISSSNIRAICDVEIKQEPVDVEEEDSSLELPSTTTDVTFTMIKEETCLLTSPLPESIDTLQNVQIGEISSLKCETRDITTPIIKEPEVKSETDLLFEAEGNLIEIRSKLLSSLDELNSSIKHNTEEKGRLLDLMKKLDLLKATVKKYEDRIRTQKMKLAMSNSFMRSLYEGVTLRSKTCSKMKDLCTVAGKKIIGPQYRPPAEFEAQIEEKQRSVKFPKYVKITSNQNIF